MNRRQERFRAPLLAGLAALLSGSTSLACSLTSPPTAPAEVMHQVGRVEASPDQHLLLYPTADAQALLGREVQRSSDGGWTIADSVAPGCEVRPRHNVSAFERTYRADINKMAALSGGYAHLLGLAANYGTSVVATVEIANAEVLSADFRGDCGLHVVNSVFVGTGRRRLERAKQVGAEATASIQAVPLRAGAGSSARVEAEVSWSSPQAYAFTIADIGGADAVRVGLDMPTRVEANRGFDLSVTSSHDAHLVVFFLEDDGRGGVLFPSSADPDTAVQAGSPRTFPLTAMLRDPTQSAKETLVVYALTDPRDFDRLRPPLGDLSDAGAVYAAQLTRELAKIPMRRWGRTTFTYVIAPRDRRE